MPLPTSMARADPTKRRRYAGLMREPVGGGMLTGAPKAIIPGLEARGQTLPLTVTNASQLFFESDSDRKFIFLQNNDPVGIVYVSVGGVAAALLQGFRLPPNGGGIVLDVNVPTAQLHMIGTIAINPNVTAVLG